MESLHLRRLFLAIELPADIKSLLENLRMNIPGAHWLPFEQLHLTLAFLGDIDEIHLECLTEELGRISVPEFQLSFSGSGCFPSLRRPRVLWLGVQAQPQLQILAGKVRAALLACGICQEERPFTAHITLARLKLSSSSELHGFIESAKTFKLPPFRVREMILFQSCLTHQGAVHTPLRSFQLSSTVGSEAPFNL